MTRIIAIAAAALFVLASPASAHEGRHETRHHDRHDYGSEVESMRKVAHQLEQAAERLYHRSLEAEKARRSDRRNRNALRALLWLEDRAEKFNDRIDRYQHRPDRLRREYDRLREAYVHAAHCFRELRVDRRTHKTMDRVSRLVYRLGHRVETVRVAERERRRKRYEVAYNDSWHWWDAYLRY